MDAQPNRASSVPEGAGPVVQRWGLVRYPEAMRRQADLHAARVAGEAPYTLVLVEHPPTFTLGRHAPADDVAMEEGELARRGIEVARADRGGRATYHGPGQVVLYPIVGIDDLGLGVKAWVCLLEGAILDVLSEHGVRGERRPATAGIWAPGGKIASVGLRVSRGVSMHGVSLNTGLDASVFGGIKTCGVSGERVTTLAAETGRTVGDEEVGSRLAARVLERMAAQRASRSRGT